MMAFGTSAPFNGDIGEGGAFVAQATAPADTDVMWLDTSENNRAKYHDGSSWVSLAASAPNDQSVGGYVTAGDNAPAWWDNDTSTGSDYVTTGPGELDSLLNANDVPPWPLYIDGFRLYIDVAGSSDTNFINVGYDVYIRDSDDNLVWDQKPATVGENEFNEVTLSTPVELDRISINVDNNGDTTEDFRVAEFQPHIPAVGRHNHQ